MPKKFSCGHTEADHRYRDAVRSNMPFSQRLRLIPGISDPYLVELLAMHQKDRSAPIRAALDAELALRGSKTDRRNLVLAAIGIVLSIIAIMVAIQQLPLN